MSLDSISNIPYYIQILYHLMKWIVDLEDLFITKFNISSIPRSTNELEMKLYDHLPIVPI